MNLLIVLIFTTLNEALVEYLVGSIKVLRPYISLISLVTAIFLTFIYRVDLFHIILGIDVVNSFLGLLLSAFIIARLSNYLNDFVQKFLRSK